MADKYEIDFQAFTKALQSGQNLNGKDSLLTPLIKPITEAALCGDVKGLRKVDASGSELELDTIPVENPLPGQGRSICGSVKYADTKL